jgi:hypothetical protein
MLWMGLVGLAHAEDLSIKDGTWSLGGSATANIVMADGGSDVFLDLSPSGGFFVADNVELLGGISMQVDEGAFFLGFYAGADVFLGGHGLAPYLGGTVQYGRARWDGPPLVALSDDSVTLSGRAGIVLPVSRKVGVDLGGRLNLNLYNGDTLLHIPLGYLGVRAFFP